MASLHEHKKDKNQEKDKEDQMQGQEKLPPKEVVMSPSTGAIKKINPKPRRSKGPTKVCEHVEWESFGDDQMPFVMRYQMKYCAKRIVRERLMERCALSQRAELTAFIDSLREFFMTVSESRAFAVGTGDEFDTSDKLVRLKDVLLMMDFFRQFLSCN